MFSAMILHNQQLAASLWIWVAITFGGIYIYQTKIRPPETPQRRVLPKNRQIKKIK